MQEGIRFVLAKRGSDGTTSSYLLISATFISDLQDKGLQLPVSLTRSEIRLVTLRYFIVVFVVIIFGIGHTWATQDVMKFTCVCAISSKQHAAAEILVFF